jgi:hypothetical protein
VQIRIAVFHIITSAPCKPPTSGYRECVANTEKLAIGDVFPIRGIPRHTYQHRVALEEAVSTFGTSGSGVLLVYGPTKSGKSVLVRKVLVDALYVEASLASTATDFWEVANAQLGTFTGRSSGKENTTTHELTSSVGIKAWWVKVSASWKAIGSRKSSAGRSANDPANAVVVRELRARGRALVIDDLHMLPRAEQRQIVQNIKPFVDDGGRVVIIAAGHRAEFIPTLIPNMSGSFTPLKFKLWDKPALAQIAKDGWAALNLDAPSSLPDELAENSFGSPQTMQRLSAELANVNVSFDRSAAKATLAAQATLHAPPDWDDFYRGTLDEILPEVRWVKKLALGPAGKQRSEYTTHDHGKIDGYRLITIALRSMLPNQDPLRDELQRVITSLTVSATPPATPRKNETTSKLAAMSRMAERPLMDDTREADLAAVEEAAGVDPVLEFQESGPTSTVRIVDPLFAFALRWWPL